MTDSSLTIRHFLLEKYFLLTANRITAIIQMKRISRIIQSLSERLVNDMISFENFTAKDGIPIYLQIVQHIQREIVAGTIRNGDEVPSRRVLSALLGVNPNTIQKAYRILEDEKLMESHSGTKSYMVLNEESVSAIRKRLLESDAVSIINSLKQMGMSKEEAISLIKNYWE